jgi:hypothetical protein
MHKADGIKQLRMSQFLVLFIQLQKAATVARPTKGRTPFYKAKKAV